MLGRVLFGLVWLIIGAGFVLPLYPFSRDGVTSVVTAANPVRSTAASDTVGCTDCPVPERTANCTSDCPCDEVLPAAFVPLDEHVRVTLAVSVWRKAEPDKLPAKLPAI